MLQVNAARLRGSDDRPFGFVLVLHDVTELRRLEVIRRVRELLLERDQHPHPHLLLRTPPAADEAEDERPPVRELVKPERPARVVGER